MAPGLENRTRNGKKESSRRAEEPDDPPHLPVVLWKGMGVDMARMGSGLPDQAFRLVVAVNQLIKDSESGIFV